MRGAIWIGVIVALLLGGDLLLNDGRVTKDIQRGVSKTISGLID